MPAIKTEPQKVEPKVEGKSGQATAVREKSYEGLTPPQLIDAYRLMYMSRRVDDREIFFKRPQKNFFQISGAGHETPGLGAGLALKPAHAWVFPHFPHRRPFFP